MKAKLLFNRFFTLGVTIGVISNFFLPSVYADHREDWRARWEEQRAYYERMPRSWTGGFETTHPCSGVVELQQGQTKTVSLGGWYNVQAVILQIEGVDRSGSTLEVWANGSMKGRFTVPGGDPSYFLTIGETTDELKITNIGGGRVVIRDVDVEQFHGSNGPVFYPQTPVYLAPVPQSSCSGQYPSPYPASMNVSSGMSKQVLAVLDVLEDFSTLEERKVFLQPVRVLATWTFSRGVASGDLHCATREGLLALVRQMQFANGFVLETLQKKALQGVGEQYWTVQFQLEQALGLPMSPAPSTCPVPSPSCSK